MEWRALKSFRDSLKLAAGFPQHGRNGDTYPEAISTLDWAMARRCKLVRFRVARATLPFLLVAPGGLVGEDEEVRAGVLVACLLFTCEVIVFPGPRMVPIPSRGLGPAPGGGGSLVPLGVGIFFRAGMGGSSPMPPLAPAAALTLITKRHCGQEHGGPGRELAIPGLTGQD